jgi:phosphatidate cytidylyltransferase
MTRLVSGIVLAAAALAMILFLPVLALRVVACGIAALAAHEYLKLVGASAALVAATVVGCWLASSGSAAGLFVVPLLVLFVTAWRVLVQRDTAPTATAGAFAVIYVGVPLGLLVATHASHGWPATVLLIASVAVSDTAQYYTGRLLGRHALAPTVSPKKTVEGALGGVVFGMLFMVLAGGRALPAASPAQLALLGGAVVALGICGDLFESQIKRLAGAKDSGTIIPGHGGVLDRIDALLFAAPAFAFYVGVLA